MIPHPRTFLLKNIVAYKDNGLKSLGHLHAEHFEDIAKMLEDYAFDAVNDIINRLGSDEGLMVEGKRCFLAEIKNKR